MAQLRCSPLLNKITRKIKIQNQIGSFQGMDREVTFPVYDKLERVVLEGEIEWVVDFIKGKATNEGEREYIKGNCTKNCPYWKACCKELGLKKEPRGFSEVPANPFAIIFKEYHLDYKGRPVIWRMNK